MDQAVTRTTGATPSTTPPPGAAPRLVGEFQGYVDGEPSVVWTDRKSMPAVGSRLYALPPRAAAPRSWSLLLTSPNHGVVGAAGSEFKAVPEGYERVQVMEIVEAGAAPAPGADLGGLVRLPLTNEQIAAGAIVRCDHGGSIGRNGAIEVWDAMIGAAPLAAQVGAQAKAWKMVAEALSSALPGWEDLADSGQESAVLAIRQLAAQAGQVAVPEGWKLVPLDPTGPMKDAGAFSGLPVAHAHETWTAAKVYRTMVGAAPAAPSAPAVAQQVPDQLEQLIIEKRIGITPENEGGFHAAIYGDDEHPQEVGYGQTPMEAIEAARPAQQAPAQAKPLPADVERDSARLDWLEQMGNEPEGLLLHDGGDFTGRRGLGLRRIGRSLRAAVDAAAPSLASLQPSEAGEQKGGAA